MYCHNSLWVWHKILRKRHQKSEPVWWILYIIHTFHKPNAYTVFNVFNVCCCVMCRYSVRPNEITFWTFRHWPVILYVYTCEIVCIKFEFPFVIASNFAIRWAIAIACNVCWTFVAFEYITSLLQVRCYGPNFRTNRNLPSLCKCLYSFAHSLSSFVTRFWDKDFRF